MNRSKDFSKHQEDKKQELLKEHGCYVLKNIKGDITVNNPENYSVEYKSYNLSNITNISLPRIITEIRVFQKDIMERNNKLEELQESIKEKEEKIFKLESDVVSCEVVIDSLERDIKKDDSYITTIEPLYDKMIILKEKGNIFQKLMLKILGL